MANPIKIIHVGLGIRGCHWLEAVRDYPGTTSVACVDAQALPLDWVKSRFRNLRGSCYPDLKKSLNQVKADAAIISSPPAFRAADVIMALEAGLAVLAEAPLAISVAEAVRILETARRSGSPLIVGQDYRYRPCEQTMRELVHQGKVGTVTHVSYVDRRTRPSQGNFLNHVDYAQLMDGGVHHFDSLRSILGVNPVRVAGRCEKAPWSMYQHGSTTEAIIEMENNIHIQYYGSLTGNRSESALWIEGDKGILRADQKRVWWRKRGWRFFLPVRTAKIPVRNRLKHRRHATAAVLDQLVSAVRMKPLPETNGEDHLWTLAMVEAVMLSDKTGKLIEIADIWNSAGIGHDLPLRHAVTA
jgi:predicted dehydrogenase